MIDPSWIAALGVILFGVGLLGTFYHKNAIVVLMCIELMLNAANLNFVAAASHYGDVSGWVFTAIAIAIAIGHRHRHSDPSHPPPTAAKRRPPDLVT